MLLADPLSSVAEAVDRNSDAMTMELGLRVDTLMADDTGVR